MIEQIEKYTKNFNKEIIIVDDNSNDGSYEVINKIRNKSLKFIIRKSKFRDLSKSCIYGLIYQDQIISWLWMVNIIRIT